MKRPLVLFVFVWILGYSLAMYEITPRVPMFVTLFLACMLIVVCLCRVPSKVWISSILLFVISLSFYQWYDARNVTVLQDYAQDIESLDRDEAVLRGHIASSVTIDGDKASFVLVADELAIKGHDDISMNRETIMVTLRLIELEEQGVVSSWRRGDTLMLNGLLQIPSPARNFGGFDYRRYLHLQQIHWQFTVKGTGAVKWQAFTYEMGIVSVLRWNDDLRQMLSERIDMIFPHEHAGFMKGMLIGDSRDLSAERFQQFSELGLTHILAISGLNIAIFLGALIWIMKALRIQKRTYLLISILVLPFYILLTGASPSVIRAGLMAMIVCFSNRQHLQKDILHVLVVVGWLMLVWNPYYLLDVSFQLSFFVTAGLILGVSRMQELLPISSKIVSSTIAVTFVSQVVSFPLTIYYFNQFSLLSGIANAFLVPAISLIVYPAGLIALGLSFLYIYLGVGLGILIGWLNELIFAMTDQLQSWRSFQMIWPSPSLMWIITYYLLAVSIYFIAKRLHELTQHPQGLANEDFTTDQQRSFLSVSLPWMKRGRIQVRNECLRYRLMMGFIVVAISGNLFIGYMPERWSREGWIQFIDVGQGDAILIRTPAGKHILIDGGGTLQFQKPNEQWKQRKSPYEVGKKLLVPLLKKRGIHQLDLLILTHLDSDHSGGLQAVLEQIPVKSFWYNGTYKPNVSNQKLFGQALSLEIPLLYAHQGDQIEVEEGTTIHILLPKENDHFMETLSDQNEQSIVFVLEMEQTRWLFTGDIGIQSELEVLQSMKNHPLTQHIDVLKIAHHGSKHSTSEAWIDYWQPRIAVISVGEKNGYGHPSPVITDRLQDNDVEVIRTDQHGEIQFKVKNGNISYRTKFEFER